MTATLGSSLKLMLGNSVFFSGVTSKKIKYNGDGIDITSDDDNGFRALLSASGTKSIDVSIEGIAKSSAIRGLIMNDTRLVSGVYILLATGERIEADFFISGYSEDYISDDVVKCSFDLMSTGLVQLVASGGGSGAVNNAVYDGENIVTDGSNTVIYS